MHISLEEAVFNVKSKGMGLTGSKETFSVGTFITGNVSFMLKMYRPKKMFKLHF